MLFAKDSHIKVDMQVNRSQRSTCNKHFHSGILVKHTITVNTMEYFQ